MTVYGLAVGKEKLRNVAGGNLLVESFAHDGRFDHGLPCVSLIQRTLIHVFYFMFRLPFSSKEERGGVIVLLKLMDDEVRLGLFIGTL